MDADERYEELRMKQLDFIEEYFFEHLYHIHVNGNQVLNRTNYKVGESYIIKYALSPENAVITLDIPRDLYNKVDNYVTSHDIEKITYEEIDKEVGA
jgi:hypothetical protein